MAMSSMLPYHVTTKPIGPVCNLNCSYCFYLEKERLFPAMLAVFASGGLFMAFEVARSPIWLVQLRGVATYLKIALVVSIELFWDWRVAILTVALVLGTFVSHLPGSFRYYSLLHGRVAGPTDKG